MQIFCIPVGVFASNLHDRQIYPESQGTHRCYKSMSMISLTTSTIFAEAC